MTSRNLLETTTVTLGDIFGNGKIYEVPPFQRDYSWGLENWEDLWEDIRGLDSAGSLHSQHYMGAIVLQTSGENRFKIIDGQQRLATLTFLALAVLKRLNELVERSIEPDANRERSELLRSQFIGTKDPGSLKYSSKLFLNENDDGFYQQHLVQLKEPRTRRLPDSHQKLWSAYRFFVDRLEERFRGVTDGAILADFLNKLVARRLLFIQIKVLDELSAYTVFETLNARGLELTSTDLLKNFLFAQAAGGRTDLQLVKKQWESIVARISMPLFPTFLFHHLNAEELDIRENRLFHHVKRNIDSREKAFALLDDLEESAEWYAALDDPQDPFWQDYPPECRNHVRALRLFRVEQYKPLILAARQRFRKDGGQLRQLLRLCMVVSFRYNIIGQRNTGDLKRAYNEAAVHLWKGEYPSTKQVKEGLGPIYLSDEELRDAFSSRTVDSRGNRKRLAMYILCELERRASNTDIDFETTEATLEHILPESPGAGWEAISEEDRERFTYRLGNYTLLEPTLNREAENKDFATRLRIYARSRYQMTRSIASADWNAEAIRKRQDLFAREATAIWRLDY